MAIEGLAEEMPWEPQPMLLVDGDRYERPEPLLETEPQDVHAGDDLSQLESVGITVVRD